MNSETVGVPSSYSELQRWQGRSPGLSEPHLKGYNIMSRYLLVFDYKKLAASIEMMADVWLDQVHPTELLITH